MKNFFLVLSTVFIFTAAPASAEIMVDVNISGSAICDLYARDRNYTGDRRQRSLDVCNAAVDALVSLGQMNRADAERDPYTHLNRVCGMNGSTFRLGDRQMNANFLNQLRSNISLKGYSISPNDFESIESSLVAGQEADLFVSSNFSNINCSTLLYVLFRIENYVTRR